MLGFGPISGAPISATEEQGGVEERETISQGSGQSLATRQASGERATTGTGEGQSVATREASSVREVISQGEGQSVATTESTVSREAVSTGEGQSLATRVGSGVREAISTGEGQSIASAEAIVANAREAVSQGSGQSIATRAATALRLAVSFGEGQSIATAEVFDPDPAPDPDFSAFLVLGGVEVQVAQGGHGATADPLAGDWMLRAVGGNTHGLLTTARGPVLEKPIRTVGMSPADADTLTAHVGGLVKLWATGWSIGGGPIQVTCTQPRRSWVSGTEVSLAFTVRSTGVVALVPEGV